MRGQGQELEKCNALKDAENIIIERGIPIKIRLYTESNVSRDKYGSIKTRSSAIEISTYSYPTIFNPTDQERDNAGLRERTGVIIYTAMRTWNQAGYTMARLQTIDLIRSRIIINGVSYEIKDKALHSHFYDTFLYITLGLNRV